MSMQLMLQRLRGWLGDEDGAITVDWVVLSAAVIGLAIAAVATTKDGVSEIGDVIRSASSLLGDADPSGNQN